MIAMPPRAIAGRAATTTLALLEGSLQESGLSVGSVRKYIAPPKVMLATAIEDGPLPANPAQGVRINAREGLETITSRM
jgi:hypothetical protein